VRRVIPPKTTIENTHAQPPPSHQATCRVARSPPTTNAVAAAVVVVAVAVDARLAATTAPVLAGPRRAFALAAAVPISRELARSVRTTRTALCPPALVASALPRTALDANDPLVIALALAIVIVIARVVLVVVPTHVRATRSASSRARALDIPTTIHVVLARADVPSRDDDAVDVARWTSPARTFDHILADSRARFRNARRTRARECA